MPSETPYRIALVIVIFLTMAVVLYFRLQAATSGEKISRKEEGCVFAIALRLAGLCLWIATFAYLRLELGPERSPESASLQSHRFVRPEICSAQRKRLPAAAAAGSPYDPPARAS